jgi:hypothetical protein
LPAMGYCATLNAKTLIFALPNSDKDVWFYSWQINNVKLLTINLFTNLCSRGFTLNNNTAGVAGSQSIYREGVAVFSFPRRRGCGSVHCDWLNEGVHL